MRDALLRSPGLALGAALATKFSRWSWCRSLAVLGRRGRPLAASRWRARWSAGSRPRRRGPPRVACRTSLLLLAIMAAVALARPLGGVRLPAALHRRSRQWTRAFDWERVSGRGGPVDAATVLLARRLPLLPDAYALRLPPLLQATRRRAPRSCWARVSEARLLVLLPGHLRAEDAAGAGGAAGLSRWPRARQHPAIAARRAASSGCRSPSTSALTLHARPQHRPPPPAAHLPVPVRGRRPLRDARGAPRAGRLSAAAVVVLAGLVRGRRWPASTRTTSRTSTSSRAGPPAATATWWTRTWTGART